MKQIGSEMVAVGDLDQGGCQPRARLISALAGMAGLTTLRRALSARDGEFGWINASWFWLGSMPATYR